MTKEEIRYANVVCPYCKRKNRYEANMNEYRILKCIKCDWLIILKPFQPQQPYILDDRPDSIYRIHLSDFTALFGLAIDMGDKEWLQELIERKRQMEENEYEWWIGEAKKDGGYYED